MFDAEKIIFASKVQIKMALFDKIESVCCEPCFF